jgi:hypothetical protein
MGTLLGHPLTWLCVGFVVLAYFIHRWKIFKSDEFDDGLFQPSDNEDSIEHEFYNQGLIDELENQRDVLVRQNAYLKMEGESDKTRNIQKEIEELNKRIESLK